MDICYNCTTLRILQNSRNSSANMTLRPHELENKQCCRPSCRYPSLQVWALWKGLHTAVLPGVPHEEDSWCSPTVCLPPETLQDLCVWGLWLHLQPPWWVLPTCETVPPWQSGPPEVLPPPGPWEQQLCISRLQTQPLPAVLKPFILYVGLILGF